MKTITDNIESLYEIKNSKFITILYKINNTNNVKNILEEVKIKYPKATHYCYAYKTINEQKSSDDGEPGGTAGIPMLNVLLKEKLINVLAITVRYFGGIKLGAGGLVRAYTKSLTTALEQAKYIELIKGYIIEIKTSYDEQKDIEYKLKNINIINKEYKEEVIYLIELPDNKLELINNYNYKIIKEDLIEKKDY